SPWSGVQFSPLAVFRRYDCRQCHREILRARKFLLADALRHSAIARICLCDRIFGGGAAANPADRRERSDAGLGFSRPNPLAAWLADRRNAAPPDNFLVWNLGPRDVDLRLGRFRAFARRC